MSVWPEERVTTAEGDLDTVDMTINVGPQHPATHGVFRMVLTVDGELVVDCEPYIGYLHRGLEKLSENADYRQAMGWWDRTDYLAGMCCEGAYVMAVEKLAGIEVPERAEYIRVMMMELSRINSHFMFLGAFGADVGLVRHELRLRLARAGAHLRPLRGGGGGPHVPHLLPHRRGDDGPARQLRVALPLGARLDQAGT